MTVTRGDKHDFLGMKIELDRKEKKVKIDTSVHIHEAVAMFEQGGDDVKGNVANPGNSSFFKSREGCKVLE